MRRIAKLAVALTACLSCLPISTLAQSQSTVDVETAVFPSKTWQKIERPEDVGWSAEKLEAAKKESEAVGSAAVVIVHRGQIVAEWGQPAKKYYVHSIRKSFLSALYGIPGLAEKIDLSATVGELGIDDIEPKLTAVEKQATIHDLIKARSGIYHPALAETDQMKRRRPERGSHAPGTFWYYNNWDFNVLGTVFKQRTGLGVFDAFEQYFAKPLEMEDFRVEDCRYEDGRDSIHPAYKFRMTARDMARFGLLFARGGKWRGQQIVPAAWVAESTTTYSPATNEAGALRCGYGYLWWTEFQGRQLEGATLPPGCFSARGSGGHYILVVPTWDLVIVHRIDTDDKTGPRATSEQFGKLVQMIVDAMPTNARKTPPSQNSMTLPQRLDAVVPALMDKYKVPGVSIVGIESRGIAWERQFGVRTAGDVEPVQCDTIFEAASMSKPLCAYAALKLVEQQKLDLDRPLSEYLDYPYRENEPRHLKITARMVLSHTTGFPNWRPGGWKSDGTLAVNFEPGTKYGYSGEGYLYLQRVIEHITGEPFEKYIHSTLLAPLGMPTANYVWQDNFAKRAAAGHDDKGAVLPNRKLYHEANTAYSLYCTPMEYAQFIVEILRRDRTGAQSLSDDSLAAMFKRTTKVKGQSAQGGDDHKNGPDYYGLGWAIDATPNGDHLCHSGSNSTGFRSFAEFDPQRGTGVVIMTNSTSGAKLWREVMDVVARNSDGSSSDAREK